MICRLTLPVHVRCKHRSASSPVTSLLPLDLRVRKMHITHRLHPQKRTQIFWKTGPACWKDAEVEPLQSEGQHRAVLLFTLAPRRSCKPGLRYSCDDRSRIIRTGAAICIHSSRLPTAKSGRSLNKMRTKSLAKTRPRKHSP